MGNRTYTLGLGINSWDDPFGLQKLLSDKLISFTDKIIIVEGRYKERDDKDKYLSVINSFIKKIDNKHPDKISFSRLFNKRQIDKRNKYFQIAGDKRLDYLLVIDSDEYVELDSWLFDNELDRLKSHKFNCFPIFANNMGYEMKFPRLFKNPGSLEYRETNVSGATSHASVYNRITGKEVIDESNHYDEADKKSCVKGLKIFHNKNLRENDRVLSDEIYYSMVPNR